VTLANLSETSPPNPAPRLHLGRSVVTDQRHRGRPRLLVGIFSTTFPGSSAMRERIRSLFRLRNDDRVCGYWDFHRLSVADRRDSSCELVYAFVVGATTLNNATEFPLAIIGNDTRPLLANVTHFNASELNDTIILNIRENMDSGKTQTWLNFAGKAADDNDIEYVAKCDEDAILNLTSYFRYFASHLPPKPYNKGFFGGRPRNKANWVRRRYSLYRGNKTNPDFIGFFHRNGTKFSRPTHEEHFDRHFNQVHIYLGGTVY
jgi:hypothetical protein